MQIPYAGPMIQTDVAPARDAATVVIVRKAGESLEVLLMKRTSRASFVAGAHVFPGGAVDDADAALELPTGSDRPVHPDGHQFLVAAVRECFEEAGLLYAHYPDGTSTSADDRSRWRRELARGERTFHDLITGEGLVLDVGPIRYLSRWVTPIGSPKRFDARFFLAPELPGQLATPDQTEITESGWFSPVDALRQADRGEMLLILPTRMTLQTLAAVTSVGELFPGNLRW